MDSEPSRLKVGALAMGDLDGRLEIAGWGVQYQPGYQDQAPLLVRYGGMVEAQKPARSGKPV